MIKQPDSAKFLLISLSGLMSYRDVNALHQGIQLYDRVSYVNWDEQPST